MISEDKNRLFFETVKTGWAWDDYKEKKLIAHPNVLKPTQQSLNQIWHICIFSSDRDFDYKTGYETLAVLLL